MPQSSVKRCADAQPWVRVRQRRTSLDEYPMGKRTMKRFGKHSSGLVEGPLGLSYLCRLAPRCDLRKASLVIILRVGPWLAFGSLVRFGGIFHRRNTRKDAFVWLFAFRCFGLRSLAIPFIMVIEITLAPARSGVIGAVPSASAFGLFGAVRSLMIATWLILPVVICLSQRLSHACLSIALYCETANGSLNQL